MTNFSINFTIPWLLILIVLALLFTLIPYFRMNKRYRGTRNRIASMVLHMIIMVLAISVLAGINFSYDLPNSENEVILLVDASFSNSESENAKNDFVESVIASNGGEFKLGIVTFGFDQVYAVELTNDMSNVVTDYLKADLPDDTATDIESALLYTTGLFKNPEGARIVLITDAVETDGVANNVIKSVAAQGVTVDTVYFRGNKTGDEVQIIGMERPEEKIKVGEPFTVNLTVQSSYAGVATIVPYDNGVAGLPVQVELVSGIQSVEIPYEFAFPGMHEMYFEMTSAGDNLTQNNQFTSYIYLESSSKILILESIAGESESIVGMLDDDLQATVINISDTASVPYTVEGLRAYDEVILCNVSNADMPEGFDKVLYEYVYEVGGGLFTVCGNEYDANTGDDEWTANAYTRDDMFGSLYQQMLPVEIINYTPPVAVVLLIDVSGSMWQPGKADEPFEDSKLNAAMKGAEACLDVLSERDYVGVVALDDYYLDGLNLTPRTQRDKILSAINSLKDAAGGGTEIIIPSSLTYIDDYAFRGCVKVDSVILPDSVTYVGKHAFYGLNKTTIFCEAEKLPGLWNERWNSSYRTVFWGCTLSEDDSYVTSWHKYEAALDNINAPDSGKAPERDGYEFVGWSVTEGSNVADYTVDTFNTVEDGVILYPVWRQKATN